LNVAAARNASRAGRVQRKTNETDISLTLILDGSGKAEKVSTGLPFLDHMLQLFAAHGLFDLALSARGDLEVDGHHTVEDIGICLGCALAEALGDKRGITRYGCALVPMDEALAEVAIDISGRPCLVYKTPQGFRSGSVGSFDLELVGEFLQALANKAGITLHVTARYGRNRHHLAEAIFKALGRALDAATRLDPRMARRIPSTKGTL
jgi:imidazoleglycerol-phosphate dehydratase